MKRSILYLLLILLPPALFSACEKEIMGYEGLEGVYFAVQYGDSWGGETTWPFQPLTNVQFVKISGDRTTLKLKVMYTGYAKDYDRTYRVEIDPDNTTATEGVDYLPLTGDVVIPANATVSYVELTLIRTAALKSETKEIGLKLVATPDFALSFPEWDAVAGFATGTVVPEFDASLHTIYVNDFLVQPTVWTGSVAADTKFETGLWGVYSQKKLELMCEMLDLDYVDFVSTTTMPTALQQLIARTVAKYLIEQYNAGTPVLETDGRLMFVSGVPWNSTVGVPWVPQP